jgi:hypothetical protein
MIELVAGSRSGSVAMVAVSPQTKVVDGHK